MAVIEEAIETRLSGWSDLTDIVGTRIYPGRVKQATRSASTLPALTYIRASAVRTHSQSGYSNLAAPRFQFDAWGDKESYGTVKDIINEVRKALVGFRGTIDGVRIDAVIAESERDEYEDDTETWRSTLDMRIWHGE